VVAGLCGRETQGEEGGLGEKPETEPPWLGFGRAVQSGSGGTVHRGGAVVRTR
jgi:hypothetical protein